MPSNPPGNRPHFVGDERTRLLTPVGRGNDCGRPYCDLNRLGVEHGHRGDLRHPVFMRFDETAVIPKVSPAPPQADWDKDDWPNCRRKSVAIALVFGAGLVVGALVATFRWWFW